MLDFIPDEIICPSQVNQNRIFKLNDKDIIEGDVVYNICREFRLEDNWAVIFAKELAIKYNKNLRIVTILSQIKCSKRQMNFLQSNLDLLKENFAFNKINFELLDELPKNVGVLVVDFNPICKNIDAESTDYAVFEVDSHNIVPSRYISDKQEFSAATLRRKIYGNIAEFLTEFPDEFMIKTTEARIKLDEFVQNKLANYSEDKNNPNIDATSNMSFYLHFGLISAQRIALDALKSTASRDNKENYLEELIVRKELADNFCLYSPSYTTFDGILNWAKESLSFHSTDLRNYTYGLNEFEQAKTHDELWNAAQRQLVNQGKIHGYLRMYWAKKILEWSKSPQDALKTAIYLNDEYALDGNDPNGYVGILWSIGGLHDRAFTNRLVTGKIRYMSLDGCKRKFDISTYIQNN